MGGKAKKAAIILFIILFGSSALTVGMERFDVVTTHELAKLLEQRKTGQIDFHLVNTLDQLIFLDQSIPGSVNVPWCRVEEMGAKTLGVSFQKLVITYCMGYR